jgi:rare lipoprotein A
MLPSFEFRLSIIFVFDGRWLMLSRCLCLFLLLSVGSLVSGCFSKAHLDQVVKPGQYALEHSPYGNPSSYTVNGQCYHVAKTAHGYDQQGIASWYGKKFNGHLTSTREVYDMYQLTAASTTLPLPVYVRVTNLHNGRQLVVRVNDRGPFHAHRILDLSYAAAKKLGFARQGTTLVRVVALDSPRAAVTTIKPVRKPLLYLQAGSFADQQHADRLRAKLGELTSLPVLIFHEGGYQQVRVGPLPSVAAFDRLDARLKQRGFSEVISVVR